MDTTKNKIASILKIIAAVLWAVGLFLAITLGFNAFTPGAKGFIPSVFLSILGGSFIIGLFTYAFGEVISLLQKIVDKAE